MNVGGAGPDGVEQGTVHEPNDGRVVGLFRFLHRRCVGFDRLQIYLVREIRVASGERRNIGAFPSEVPFDRNIQLVCRSDSGFDVDTYSELDRVERANVGRVRQGDMQRVAAPDQGQNVVAPNELFVEIRRQRIRVESGDVDGGHAELPTCAHGDHIGLDQTAAQQVPHQRPGISPRRVECFACLVGGKDAIFDQSLGQTGQWCLRGFHDS